MTTQGPVTNETTPDTALAMINATQENVDTETPIVDAETLNPEQRLLMVQSAAAAAAALAPATVVQRDLLGCPKWCGKYCVQMGIGCGTLSRRRRQLTDNTKQSHCRH
jgi:hypothetical protein